MILGDAESPLLRVSLILDKKIDPGLWQQKWLENRHRVREKIKQIV